MKPVGSFHASTTYGPAAAIETSDCPCADTPAGLTSSPGRAASTLAAAEGPSAMPGSPWAPLLGCGPKQYACAPDDAWYCLPSRAQNVLPAWAPVVRRAASATGRVRAAFACLARGALAAPACGATAASASMVTGTVVIAVNHHVCRILSPCFL